MRIRLPDGRQVTASTLADVDLAHPWQVPVELGAPGFADRVPELTDGVLELADERGLARVEVALRRVGGVATVTGLGRATVHQRRDDVRGGLELDLHLARFDDHAADGFAGPIVRATSIDVSAGGLQARLDRRTEPLLQIGARVYTEVSLPGEALVRAVSLVVAADPEGRAWRVRFERVDGAGRDLLARLVFVAHRAELAERARRRDRRVEVVGR